MLADSGPAAAADADASGTVAGPPRPRPAGFAFRLALGLATAAILLAVLAEALAGPPADSLHRLALAAALLLSLRLLLGPSGLLARLPEPAFLALLVGSAAGARLLWVAASPNPPVSDFAIYHELALSLLSGHGYALTGPVGQVDLDLYLGTDKTLPYTTAFRAPGVPLLGAVLHQLLGPSPMVMKLANAALGTATALLLHLLLARAGSARLGRVAGLLWALYPSAVFATNLYGSEVPFAFLLVLAAFLLGRPLAAGLAAGATCLVRPMWFTIALAALVALRFRLRPLLRFLAVMALAIAPWTARNALTFHRFIPIATADGSFLFLHSHYTLPAAVRQGPEASARWHEWASIADEVERSRRGFALARANLAELLRQGPARVLTSLVAATRSSFGGDDEILLWSVTRWYGRATSPGPNLALGGDWLSFFQTLNRGFYLAIVAAALGAFARRGFPRLAAAGAPRFLLAYFLFTFPFHAILTGPGRYHFGLMPALILLAALGLAGDEGGA